MHSRTIRLGLAFVVAGLLSLPGQALARAQAAPCPGAQTPALTAATTEMREAVTCLVNRERTRRGLPALQESRLLDRSAQGWSDKMVAIDQFTHGLDFAARLAAVGFDWSFAGENIATGFGTPADVVRAWMASSGHCRNILDPHFSRVGTGINRHAIAVLGTGPGTWTQDFALPASAQPPSGNHGPQNGCPH